MEKTAASLPATTILFLIRIYQNCISPLTGPCCRFSPSCSAYATEAINKQGVMAGLALSFWRLLRCQPFANGGHDPVPASLNLKKYNPYRKLFGIQQQTNHSEPDPSTSSTLSTNTGLQESCLPQ